MVDITTVAIPFFFLSMGIELVVGRVKGRRIFRGPDVLANLSLGSMQALAGVVGAVGIIGGYAYLYEHHRIWTIGSDSVIAWVALFLGQDFLYYWFHRSAHRINIAWAFHAPHHSSEDFNYAVALRQGPLQPFLSHLFYLPLAVVGFPLEMFATVGGINTVYQFFVHTELVGKLGPLEWVLNTPSHHRVHHGCNGKYLDRNHAGMLIIWDRMFGTFEPEAEVPVYGTVKQIGTWNPLAAAAAPFVDIAKTCARAERFVDKLLVWIMPPEWVPRGVEVKVTDVVARSKFDERARGVGKYVTPMFMLTLLVLVAFLVFGGRLSTPAAWVVTGWLVVSMTTLGALLDGRAWAKPLEVARVAAAVPIALVLFVA